MAAKKTRQVVVLASKKDPHVDLVKQYLRHEPLVIDFGDLSAGLSYKLEGKDSRLTVTYDGRRLDLGRENIVSIWNRRTHLRWLVSDLNINPPEEKEYALSALQNHADSLRALLPSDVLWVSDYKAVARASHKPLQLELAKASGFNVPATLFTSSSQEAEAFVKKYGNCIIKAQATLMPAGKIQYAVVRQGHKIDFRGLEVTPHIFQELIQPAYEVRAVVVGNEVFASIVEDSEEKETEHAAVRDFRASFLKGTFETVATTLPKSVAESCIQYVRRFGLVCGYFDLICDKSGKWWFIECNPNGQWGFVDKPTVDRIAEAMARLLESGQH